MKLSRTHLSPTAIHASLARRTLAALAVVTMVPSPAPVALAQAAPLSVQANADVKVLGDYVTINSPFGGSDTHGSLRIIDTNGAIRWEAGSRSSGSGWSSVEFEKVRALVATPDRGYRFLGWAEDVSSSSSSRIATETPGEITVEEITAAYNRNRPRHALNLTPLFVSNDFKYDSYTIRFDYTGGSGNVTSLEVMLGDEHAIGSGSATRLNYQFAGWALTRGAEEPDYLATDSRNLLDAIGAQDGGKEAAGVTLYAVWDYAYEADNPLNLYPEDRDYWVDEGDGTETGSHWYVYRKGALRTNCWVDYKGRGDWYWLGPDGEMFTGLQQLTFLGRTDTYYFNDVHDGTYGRMLKGWQLVNGAWRYFNRDSEYPAGAMAKNVWKVDGKTWYYLRSDGSMAKGEWQDNCYLSLETGAMATNAWCPGGDGYLYHVGANGKRDGGVQRA